MPSSKRKGLVGLVGHQKGFCGETAINCLAHQSQQGPLSTVVLYDVQRPPAANLTKAGPKLPFPVRNWLSPTPPIRNATPLLQLAALVCPVAPLRPRLRRRGFSVLLNMLPCLLSRELLPLIVTNGVELWSRSCLATRYELRWITPLGPLPSDRPARSINLIARRALRDTMVDNSATATTTVLASKIVQLIPKSA